MAIEISPYISRNRLPMAPNDMAQTTWRTPSNAMILIVIRDRTRLF